MSLDVLEDEVPAMKKQIIGRRQGFSHDEYRSVLILSHERRLERGGRREAEDGRRAEVLFVVM